MIVVLNLELLKAYEIIFKFLITNSVSEFRECFFHHEKVIYVKVELVS